MSLITVCIYHGRDWGTFYSCLFFILIYTCFISEFWISLQKSDNSISPRCHCIFILSINITHIQERLITLLMSDNIYDETCIQGKLRLRTISNELNPVTKVKRQWSNTEHIRTKQRSNTNHLRNQQRSNTEHIHTQQ